MEREYTMEIDIFKAMHYEIYIDGRFYCSCDNRNEIDEELEELNECDNITRITWRTKSYFEHY